MLLSGRGLVLVPFGSFLRRPLSKSFEMGRPALPGLDLFGAFKGTALEILFPQWTESALHVADKFRRLFQSQLRRLTSVF